MPVLGIALKGLAEMQAVKIEVQEKKIAQEKLKELNKNLEEIIYERTAELQVNNEELKANEDQLYETNLKLNEQTDELMKTINIINNGQVVAFLLQNKEGWPVEYVSANVNEIFGYSKDEFMSGEISYSQIVHEDDLHIVGKEIEENSRKSFINKFAHQPYRIITKNNVTKWIDNRTEIIRNVKNEITHFQGTIIDVTEKIFANKKAKQTELQILAMANNTDSIIYIKDIQGKYILINNQFEKLFKTNKESIVGKTVFDIFPEEAAKKYY
jgi:PAS domain S-box-containing protein